MCSFLAAISCTLPGLRQPLPRYIPLLFIFFSFIACKGQYPSNSKNLADLTIANPKSGFNSGLLDRNGNIWFGSFGTGLYRFDGEQFRIVTEADGLCSSEINTIFEDKKGMLWLGTSDGLCTYDGELFSHVSIPFQDTSSVWLDQVYPVINPNAVHAIIQDKKGRYWLGTGGGGAYMYDGKTFTSVLADEGRKYADSLYHNWIPDIAEDASGNIWFASMSYGGLNRFDGETYTRYLQKDGLSDDMIRKIHVDKNGKIWLGFNGNRKSALTVFDGDAFHIFTENRDVCHRNIRAMYEDKNANLWLGGEDGICILSKGQFSEFLNAGGQSFKGITFILEDKNQRIWFGGRFGLWVYNGTDLIELTRG